MIIQLSPSIPVFVVSKNISGQAIGWIDYSEEYHLFWIVFLDNGECWTVPNTDIRAFDNKTLGRINKK